MQKQNFNRFENLLTHNPLKKHAFQKKFNFFRNEIDQRPKTYMSD